MAEASPVPPQALIAVPADFTGNVPKNARLDRAPPRGSLSADLL